MRFALAVVVLVSLTGCGQATMIQPAATHPRAATTISAAFSCQVHDSASHVALRFFEPGADADCQEFIVAAAKKGAYFTEVPADLSSLTIICQLENSSNAGATVLADAAGSYDGSRYCAALVAGGFRDIPPDP